jgi:ribonuclease Z
MSLLGRQKRLTLVAPSALEEIIELQQSAGKSRLDFEIDFISTDRMRPEAAEIVYSDKQIEVSAFGLKHRIACCGYLFRQRKKPKTYLPERGLKYAVPVSAIASIKAGEDYIRENGEVVKNSELTKAPIDPSSYAFCTDTLPLETTIRHVQGVECLYHEATFLQRESDRARKTFHTTAIQAAEIARLARVKMLVIGHFSARYEDLTPLKEEAESAFYTVELAEQGRTFLISS